MSSLWTLAQAQAEEHKHIVSESNCNCSYSAWVNTLHTPTCVSLPFKTHVKLHQGDLNVQLSLSWGKVVSQLLLPQTGSQQPCPCGHFQSDSVHSEWCMTHYLGERWGQILGPQESHYKRCYTRILYCTSNLSLRASLYTLALTWYF